MQASQEGINALEERRGMLAELAGRGENRLCERARLFGSIARAGDVDRNLAGTGGDLLHALRNLARRRPLFLHG